MAARLDDSERAQPGQWVTLGIAIIAAFIVVLDNTVLNVSIPTIMRDLHTTLPSLQWVVTGYALTFAALLIIGGRLGDVFGHRNVFIIGTGLFGIGSLLASVSTSVGELVLGEAIIEGIGASLMLPATLAILSGTFTGRMRATAFAAWGATAGVAAAMGPVVGGFLTTNYSWRWSFRINVIVAPLTVIGAVLFMSHEARPARRPRIDIPGAVLIAVGMFLVVFGLSEGGTYGWWAPLVDFTVAGTTVWARSTPVSIIPVVEVVGVGILAGFVVLEVSKQRRGRDPLFDFVNLRFKTYRYGLLTALVLSMGQLGVSFVLPLFLQNAKHLTAAQNGLWMLPSGLFVIAGAQLAGILTRRLGTTNVVRIGLLLYTAGVLVILSDVSLSITAWSLLPGLALYGGGIGFAVAQLTSVVLSDIPQESAGAAGGANSTVRQVGSALGVSVIGSLLTVRTIAAASAHLRATRLPPAVKAQVLSGVKHLSTGYSPPGTLSAANAALVRHALGQGIISGTRWALIFAAAVIAIGALLSLLIPNDRRAKKESILASVEEELAGLNPLMADPAFIPGEA